MASYLEIKELLQEVLIQGTEARIDVDEASDIIIPIPSYTDRRASIILPNDTLYQAYDHLQNYTYDRLEMKTATSLEIVLQISGSTRGYWDLEPIIDGVNGITYSIGRASLEYCLFLLNSIVEIARETGRMAYFDLRQRARMRLRHGIGNNDDLSPSAILADLLRAYTLKVESSRPRLPKEFRKLASSFEFHYMYKKGIALSEYSDILDMYSLGSSGFRNYRTEIDTPPQRLYNTEVLDYYSLALESRDPFTMYISFYHIVEHYFDAVYRKKLTEEIKEKLTRPDFSYKREDKLYELAKYIRKHMSSDDQSGKGDEFESLKYVLMEYVPINELKERIDELNPQGITYYQNSLIPFVSSKKTKIAWTDPIGVFTNLATRIYETRNALVHSKSEQADNQYRPYENKKELIAEIALIKSVAELVIINSSEII